MLNIERGLPEDKFDLIWQRKQELTASVISETIEPNISICKIFEYLKTLDIKIFVCSNSIRHTTKMYLLKLNLMQWVDEYISNEDVKCSKPNPSMYIKAMLMADVEPRETLVVEDSHYGIKAAILSGANVSIVSSPNDLSQTFILKELDKYKFTKPIKWKNKNMNILIPMAGAGSRFSKAGYSFPKPLVEIQGKPMIQVVVENLNIDATYTYVVQKEHYEKFNLKYMLNFITPGCNIIVTDGVTEGAACTTLLAKEFIDKNEPLLIANSDQYIEWDSSEFFYSMSNCHCDGGILVFKNTHPKWSYVKTDSEGNVVELREKQVISDMATVGVYYWKSGSDYVKYAEQMIEQNIRVNNEFYVAPVYNQIIVDGGKIKTYMVKEMWGIGTPEDLNTFLKLKK
jgi:beta-phosphoglucomutase-like phosphatase (HAD superfamily)/dTDP-glucose pyrophosphorylase